MIIAMALLILAVTIFAKVEEKLYDIFNDPEWMNKNK